MGVQRLGVVWSKHGKVHGSLSKLRMGQLGIFPLRTLTINHAIQSKSSHGFSGLWCALKPVLKKIISSHPPKGTNMLSSLAPVQVDGCRSREGQDGNDNH